MQSPILFSGSEELVDMLRHEIVYGIFHEGAPLRPDELAVQYGVSKIPVREALHALRSEGLVTHRKNLGLTVSALSADEIEEIYIMRAALESIALERALPRLRPADLIEAESTLKKIDATGEIADWVALNWHFHLTLYLPSGMPHLIRTIYTLHNNVIRYLLRYLKLINYIDASQSEHWEILEACKSGSVETAVPILNRHLTCGVSQILTYMRGEKNPGTGK